MSINGQTVTSTTTLAAGTAGYLTFSNLSLAGGRVHRIQLMHNTAYASYVDNYIFLGQMLFS